jgi:hypothetical protein
LRRRCGVDVWCDYFDVASNQQRRLRVGSLTIVSGVMGRIDTGVQADTHTNTQTNTRTHTCSPAVSQPPRQLYHRLLGDKWQRLHYQCIACSSFISIVPLPPSPSPPHPLPPQAPYKSANGPSKRLMSLSPQVPAETLPPGVIEE